MIDPKGIVRDHGAVDTLTPLSVAYELRAVYPMLSPEQAEGITTCVIGSFVMALARGNSVYLPGVGKLHIELGAPRCARNIHTGAAIVIPAKRRVRFTVNKQLENQLNENSALPAKS